MNRVEDLCNRSLNKGIYTYSGFMYEYEAAAALNAAHPAPDRDAVALFGGFPEAERVVMRFGRPSDIAYEEPFPIAVLCIRPVSAKFSDELTHRDFLGALMNLGIERNVIGDIILKDGSAWVCVLEKMAEHICRELDRVKHTNVSAVPVNEVPENARPEKETILINVASARADSVVSRFCNMARSKVPELFRTGRVFINGIECHSESRGLKENDSVTVRGYGKFFYRGIRKETKKKREVVMIERYKR